MVQPVRHPQEPDDPEAGRTADPQIIAERRAFRAELNEAALRARAVDAETRLAEAQRLLGGAHDQRKDLAARLKQAERDLRAARQGEHAETRRRVELEEDAGAAGHQAEQEIAALRRALAAGEQRVRELEEELERVQRTAAELQHAVAAAQARHGVTGPAPGTPDGARDAVAAELPARQEEVRLVEERLAAGRTELAQRRGGLQSRLHDTEVVAGGLEEQLVVERERRVRAVAELEDERERASAEVTLLQHELDRRLQIQETVSRQLVELRAELAQTQSRVASDADRRAAAESLLDELGTAALQLRDELRSLEDEHRNVERQLATAREQVAERDAQLAEQSAYLSTADAALAALRVELNEAATALQTTSVDLTQHQERLDAAERAVEQAEAQSRHLAEQLAGERRDRARAEGELYARIAEAQDAADAAIAAARTHFADGATAATARAEHAEAQRDRLQAERDAQKPGDDVQASLARLRSELVHVHAETAERAAREAQLESLVSQLISSASSLKQGFARELEATAAERDLQLAAERERFSAQLADMEQRVTEMREHLAAAGTVLSRQLEAERAARWTAEEQLRSMRELSSAAAAVDPAEIGRLQSLLTLEQETAARAEDRIVELEDELERVRVGLRPPPPMPPADHPALRDVPPVQPSGSGDPDSVIIDLARAAARLRFRREEALGEAAPETADTDAPGDVPSAAPPAMPAPPAPEPAAMSVLPVSAPADPAPEHAPEHAEVEIGRRSEVADPRSARSWLTPAIRGLAERDPRAAASTLQALIPAQAARLQQNLTYDLFIEDHAALRVRLHQDGTSAVALRTAEQQEDTADFRIAGPAGALAPLFGGETGRRAPAGVAITGRRRRARKLLRALRRPVTLGTLATADVELSSVELLTLVMGAIDPAGTDGERFTISFADAEGPVRAHVVVADTMPLDVRPGAPVHTTATVRTVPGTLASFLAGDAAARVSGDVSVVGRLLAWADAAQGLDG